MRWGKKSIKIMNPVVNVKMLEKSGQKINSVNENGLDSILK